MFTANCFLTYASNRYLVTLCKRFSSTYKRGVFKLYNEQNLKIFEPVRKFSLSYKVQNDTTDSILGENDMIALTNRLYRQPGTSHNVLVIQPRLKLGPDRETEVDAKCKLAEAVALIKTLPQWKVVKDLIVNTSCIKSKLVFGTGNLGTIRQIVQQNLSISAVFIGINIMTALQVSELEKFFNVPVFDRYQIILQIFHDHAHTNEAKLQLALAEIPYLKVKLASYYHTRDSTNFSEIHHVGGGGETFMEKRKQLLKEREVKLKKALEKVKNQRQLLRNSERRNAHPLIAVVGYTNCGKTTLIKALTNDAKLMPEDKLFATLDVTLHLGLLPSNQKTLYIDTVGFISDVPTTLIQSFRSTLEEVTLADLLIHVRDISHPDTEKQKQTVLKTLQELDLPEKLLNTILEVRNKADLLDSIPEQKDDRALYISATSGMGLPKLLEIIEKRVFRNTGRNIVLMRIPNGGREYSWLIKECGIRDAIADQKDPCYLIVEVALSTSCLAKFRHTFGDCTIRLEEIQL